MSSYSRTRTGFTLIELMVSMTVTLIIMAILSQAFVMGLKTFSVLRGIGEMQRNLQTAMVVMRSDLGTFHFEGNRRLSDPNITTNVPQAGFLAIKQGTAFPSANYVFEGRDNHTLPSYRTVDHALHLTSRRIGNRQESFFTATLQGGVNSGPALTTFFSKSTAFGLAQPQIASATVTLPYTVGATTGYYSSQWSEVLYYLVPTGNVTDLNATMPIPLYSLYRAQFVMTPDTTNLLGAIPSSELAIVPPMSFTPPLLLPATPPTTMTFAGMACNPIGNSLTYYSPADAAVGNRTINLSALSLPVTAADPQAARLWPSSALVLPNVVSFQVQLMSTGSAGPAGTFSSFGDLPNTALVYDSASTTNTFGLKGLQITLRVWDAATRQTRQVTIMQDL